MAPVHSCPLRDKLAHRAKRRTNQKHPARRTASRTSKRSFPAQPPRKTLFATRGSTSLAQVTLAPIRASTCFTKAPYSTRSG